MSENREDEPAPTKRLPVSALEIFGLCGFAVAAPLFDLLGHNPEFFVAHGGSATDVVGLSVGLIVLPALACIAGHRLLSLFGARVAWLSGLGWVGGLSALVAWIPLNRGESLDELLAGALAIAVGGGAAALYARLPRLRDLLRLGGLAPPAFVLLFLLQPGLAPLLWPAQPERHAAEGRSLEQSSTAPPIVVLVLDELPLSSIQDANGDVDAVRFPAFAALAADAIFFTGVSTVAFQTDLALPAILTGRYPGTQARLPVLANYPDNLFSLLAERHQLNVMESVSLLYPESPLTRELLASGRGALPADVALVYLHLILPSRLREELPPVTDHWGGFWERGGVDVDTADEQIQIRNRVANRRIVRAGQVDLIRFRRYVEALRDLESDGRPALHFLHLVYPHYPWRVLPSGSIYLPDNNIGRRKQRWPDEPWWSVDAFRRHLLQSMHADRLLAEFVDVLREEGLYDRAVLVVVADHGASFWPHGTFRDSKAVDHPADVLSVPLLIKAPGAPRGVRIERAGELVDLLPTLAQLADFEVPWPMDGCSLLDPGCKMRPSRRLYETRGPKANSVFEYPIDVVNDRAALERKLALFGDDELGLYRAGRGEGIAGRRVEDFEVTDEPAGTLHIDRSVRAIYRGKRPGVRPARLVGHLALHRQIAGEPELALAVGGVVQVTVPAPRGVHWMRRVSAMLPEDVLDGVPDALSAYLVEARTGAAPVLHPLEIR